MPATYSPLRLKSMPPLRLWPDDPPADVYFDSVSASINNVGPRDYARRKRQLKDPQLTPFLVPQPMRARLGLGPDVELPLVLVFPGGGYVSLTVQAEGRRACNWLNLAGVHCVVVEYRTMRRHPAPLLDARRAVQLVRLHAAAWRVAPRIGVLGFSAGGHVAGHVSLAWDAAEGGEVDKLLSAKGDRAAAFSARPDAAILAYPLVSAHNDTVDCAVGRHPFCKCSTYACVGEAARGQPRPLRHHGSFAVLLGPDLGKSLPRTAEDDVSLDDLALRRPASSPPPPFFLWHTESDDIVPFQNTERLAAALRSRGGAVEAHIFRGAGLKHGLGLAMKFTGRDIGNWTGLCEAWAGANWQPHGRAWSRG